MTFTPFTSPRGHSYARIFSSGEVTPPEAEAAAKMWAPGGPYENVALLAVIDPSANYSPEARQVFTKSSAGGTQPVAIVVRSAPMRVMLSFIVRTMGASKFTRFFSTEEQALAFIEETLGARPSAQPS